MDRNITRRTRIKLCGLTRKDDVQYAVALGVDAIGLVFYPPSPRAVTVEQAAELARYIPPFVTMVGLFVNANADTIRRVIDAVPLTMLQFHGDETPAQCQALAATVKRPWIRALRVRCQDKMDDLATLASDYAAASGLLFDTSTSMQGQGYGGSGKTFDWLKIPKALRHQIILSGGLNAQNVSYAIAQIRPYAVDVSSGIEGADAKGIKDHPKMVAFVRAVRIVDEVDG